MIIDFHTHALSPAIKNNLKAYLPKDAAFASIFSGEKVKIGTADDLIASMEKDGVDVSLIVNYSWTTGALCAETNDYVLESVARYPKHLAGFCAVNSLTDDTALKEIERCVKAGIKGVGELRLDTFPPDWSQKDRLKPFYDLVKRYKLIVLVHSSEPVGHIYDGKGNATPGLLYNFITALPDVPIVCAHWGGGLPFYALMPEVRAALENVYFDTAASPFLYRPEIYRQVSELIGSDRILFGSDFPVMPQGRVLNEIRAAEMSDDARMEILETNARRLLGI